MVKCSFTKVTPMNRPEIQRQKMEKTGDGLKPDCIAKGSKVSSSEKNVHVLVAMTYQKDVLICEQFGKMNGANFAGFIL